MAGLVYIACAFLSFSCTVMLWKAYNKNNFRLLFWSSIGFFGFAVNNVLLFVDMILLTDLVDLSVIRTIPALVGMVLLIYGLIMDTV